MFVDNKTALDESEVTMYLSSLEDPSLCPEGTHVFTLIGPSMASWPKPSDPAYKGADYREHKEREAARMIGLLERRFPGFSRGVLRWELGTPSTIERYLGKPGGSVAGPKQAIGQELMRRPHARTRWPGLYLAGESTVMGTGTPAVTISGISAADVVLRDRGLPEYRWHPGQKNVVTVREGPVPRRPAPTAAPGTASLCQWCEVPACRTRLPVAHRHPWHPAAHGDGEPRRRGTSPARDRRRAAAVPLVPGPALRARMPPYRVRRDARAHRREPELAVGTAGCRAVALQPRAHRYGPQRTGRLPSRSIRDTCSLCTDLGIALCSGGLERRGAWAAVAGARRRKGEMTVTLMILAAMFLLVPIGSAFAYIDPGTGSMIVQVVIAALVGGAAFIGAFWRKLFRRRRDQDDDQTDTENE